MAGVVRGDTWKEGQSQNLSRQCKSTGVPCSVYHCTLPHGVYVCMYVSIYLSTYVCLSVHVCVFEVRGAAPHARVQRAPSANLLFQGQRRARSLNKRKDACAPHSYSCTLTPARSVGVDGGLEVRHTWLRCRHMCQVNTRDHVLCATAHFHAAFTCVSVCVAL